MKNINVSLFVVSLVLVVMPVMAWAQINSGPDGIGIYFDLDATVVSTTAVVGDVVHAYLIATNLTQEEDIVWWETVVYAEFDPDGPPGGLAWVSGEPTNGGFNYAMNIPGMSDWVCHAGSFTTPLQCQQITLLANLDIIVFDDTHPILLFSPSVYWVGEWSEEGGILLNPSSGSASLPVATINGYVPVAIENTEWDNIKSMFR